MERRLRVLSGLSGFNNGVTMRRALGFTIPFLIIACRLRRWFARRPVGTRREHLRPDRLHGTGSEAREAYRRRPTHRRRALPSRSPGLTSARRSAATSSRCRAYRVVRSRSGSPATGWIPSLASLPSRAPRTSTSRSAPTARPSRWSQNDAVSARKFSSRASSNRCRRPRGPEHLSSRGGWSPPRQTPDSSSTVTRRRSPTSRSAIACT